MPRTRSTDSKATSGPGAKSEADRGAKRPATRRKTSERGETKAPSPKKARHKKAKYDSSKTSVRRGTGASPAPSPSKPPAAATATSMATTPRSKAAGRQTSTSPSETGAAVFEKLKTTDTSTRSSATTASAAASAGTAVSVSATGAVRKVCAICNKNSLQDPRNMVTFSHLGTFHIFCGKIAAISVPKLPDYEIQEKKWIRQKKKGASPAVKHALATCVSAVGDDGKEYVSFPDFNSKLEAARLVMPEDSSPGRRRVGASSAGSSPKRVGDPVVRRAIENAHKAGRALSYDPRASVDTVTAATTPAANGATYGSVVIASQPALGLANLATAAAGIQGSDVRRRSCVCGHTDCYLVMDRWARVGDNKRVGYVSLPAWSTKLTSRGVTVNQFRELVFHNLLGDKAQAVDENGHKSPRKYVAFHHFEEYQLQSNNMGLVDYIEPEVALSRGLTEEYKIVSGPNTGKYMPSPRRPWTDMMTELINKESLKLSRQFRPGPTSVVAASKQKGSTTKLSAVDNDALKKRLDDMPSDYEALKARYVEAETDLAEQKQRTCELEEELNTTRMSMHTMQQNQMQLKSLVHKMFVVSQKM